jgi:hypothetical protein
MATEPVEPVRPTLRVLSDDLGIALPTVDEPVHALDHPLVARAQLVPLAEAVSGSERVLSLVDRVWLKVKTARHRGGVTTVSAREAQDLSQPGMDPRWLEGWWLGFAGMRSEGSPEDVYATVLSHSQVAKRDGHGGVDTGWLLPNARDAKRSVAEFAAREERAMRAQVLAMIVESATSGRPITTRYGHHAVTVLVKVPDNLTYLAIGVDGVRHDNEIATLLACVPGVEPASWGVEPGGVLGLKPHPGQLIYSTALEPTVLADLIDQFPPGTLDVE